MWCFKRSLRFNLPSSSHGNPLAQQGIQNVFKVQEAQVTCLSTHTVIIVTYFRSCSVFMATPKVVSKDCITLLNCFNWVNPHWDEKTIEKQALSWQ
jgi:hypothetical protein